MKHFQLTRLFFSLIVLMAINASAQNPLITNMYSADPTARVFGDSVYIYPSHDILATAGHGRVGWFCMEDYHVFASKNLTYWKDDGVVVTQNKIPWVKPDSYSMWAPDCIERNGKYYFYFPTIPKDSNYGKGFAIGIAIADKPSGPFTPQTEPIKNVHGIDPNVFIDKDGQAYLYWAAGNIFGAKLKANMLELESEPKILGTLPDKGLKEGPFVFERNGIYYLTYPHVENKTERLEYAISDNPLGPFKIAGVIMDETADCWTNHQSILAIKKQWYLFYHHNDLSPDFDKARSIRADSLFFNEDGTIKKVRPTLRGIGITNATSQIQIDRFSDKSDNGVSINFNDTANKFNGWKTILAKQNSWIQYNSIDFGKKPLMTVLIKTTANTGGNLELRIDSIDGPLIAAAKIPENKNWEELSMNIIKFEPGIHHLFVISKDSEPVEIDWVSFK